MTLIEGVGDEVTDFFIIVSVLLVGWLAWCSTNITDQPLIRTVLILQHRTWAHITELRANHQNVSSTDRPPSIETSPVEAAESSTNDGNAATRAACSVTVAATGGTTDESTTISTAAVSEEALIEAMDSFNNDDSGVPRSTIKFDTSLTSTNTSDSSSDVTEYINDRSPPSNADQISIKLKFMNDDQKWVTGRLKEMLGDFKRRHFQMEFESQKQVRLVFNGQVLQPDSQTLERCGLYNNCVVHCLVYQPRPTPTTSSQSTSLDSTPSIYFSPQPFQNMPTGAGLSAVRNEWDLSRILISIITLILGLAWYSRYHYAQLFTATTTFALYALTAIFTISLFGHFFPDQDSIRNIE